MEKKKSTQFLVLCTDPDMTLEIWGKRQLAHTLKNLSLIVEQQRLCRLRKVNKIDPDAVMSFQAPLLVRGFALILIQNDK